MAPELRPYSALNVELSTLNSDTVLIDGWNVTCEFDRSFRLMPLTMKFTDVSRLPAVMNENAPWPRSGALSRRSAATCCRPASAAEVDEVPAVERNLLDGLFGHRRTDATVAVSISGDVPVTVTFSDSAPTLSFKLRATTCAGPSGTSRF
jgi:hypothetical protein